MSRDERKDVSQLVEFVRQRASDDAYEAYYRNLLCELLEIDTSIQSDVEKLAANEAKLFEVIEREIRSIAPHAAKIERAPINCEIEKHPYYSIPYYTCTDGRTEPLSCAETYSNRCNLFVIFEPDGPAESGRPAIYNAHVDTVAPWFGPRVEGPLIFGRGACDDKGQVALLIAQIRLIEEVRKQFGIKVPQPRVYQFVIEEEMGGNGSLSAALDERFRGYEVVVHEITDNIPHPANRGAVWYKCVLKSAGVVGARPVEMWPFVIRELEREGQKIKAESTHPLFGPEHVQTNHGVLGCYGEHPSAVNDHVAFTFKLKGAANPERLAMRITEIIDSAVKEYCQRYGDKTKEIDPETGKPKVQQHYKLNLAYENDMPVYRLDVYGKAGHMGALAQCDGAITKAAVIMLALMQVAKAFPQIHVEGNLADLPSPPDPLVLEGGQGFVPTHDMEQIMSRLRQAAERGVKEYCQYAGLRFDPTMVEMTFDKLHNDAYASPVDCPAMQAFRWAFGALGQKWPEPRGWQVSCDARIYAKFGHNVVTFGPGTLREAHSDTEFIDTRKVREALQLSVLQTLRLAGAI